MRKPRLHDRHRAVEPGHTPDKAEGGRDLRKKPSLEPGRTPGKAEGGREHKIK